MANIGTLTARLGVDTRPLARATRDMKTFTTQATQRFKRMTRSVFSLQGAILALAGGYGLKRLAGSAIDTASGFEQMRIKLDALTRGRGIETLERINEWALDMPVNTMKAVEAFTRMTAMGLKPTIKTMETLVDVASIFGEDTLPRISRALGQMQTLGKLSAEELNQLAEAGINARKYITSAFGMTVEELQKSSVQIEQIIDVIWKGLAVDFGGAARESQRTWKGLTATFESYVTEIERSVMAAGAFSALKSALDGINKGMKAWLEKNEALIAIRIPEYVEGSVRGLGAMMTAAGKTVQFIESHKTLAEYGILGWLIRGKKGLAYGVGIGYLTEELEKIPASVRNMLGALGGYPYRIPVEVPVKEEQLGAIQKIGQGMIDLGEQFRNYSLVVTDSAARTRDFTKSVADGTGVIMRDSRALESRLAYFTKMYEFTGQSIALERELSQGLLTESARRRAAVQEEFDSRIAQLQHFLELGVISEETFTSLSVDALQIRIRAFQELADKMDNTFDYMEQMSIQAARNIQNAFGDFFFNVMKGNFDNLLDVGRAFADAMMRMMAELAAKMVIMRILAGIFSGGAGFGAGPTVLTAQHGGLINEPIAGVGRSGTGYLFGEAGPEWVVPATNKIDAGPSEMKLVVENRSSAPVEARAEGIQYDEFRQMVVSIAIEDISRDGPLRGAIKRFR